jgi:hypothetical protein
MTNPGNGEEKTAEIQANGQGETKTQPPTGQVVADRTGQTKALRAPTAAMLRANKERHQHLLSYIVVGSVFLLLAIAVVRESKEMMGFLSPLAGVIVGYFFSKGRSTERQE